MSPENRQIPEELGVDYQTAVSLYGDSFHVLRNFGAANSIGLTEPRDIGIMNHTFAIRLGRLAVYNGSRRTFGRRMPEFFSKAPSQEIINNYARGVAYLEDSLDRFRTEMFPEDPERARDVEHAINELAAKLTFEDEGGNARIRGAYAKTTIETLHRWSEFWKPKLNPEI